MEKLTYTHNEAAAKVLASFYDTPPLAYVRTATAASRTSMTARRSRAFCRMSALACAITLEHADLILFNTCAVREHAEQRVFGNVGALKKLKEQNPRLIIGVCGCMAQQAHIVEKLRQSYPYVDLVFGVDGIDRLPAHAGPAYQPRQALPRKPRGAQRRRRGNAHPPRFRLPRLAAHHVRL